MGAPAQVQRVRGLRIKVSREATTRTEPEVEPEVEERQKLVRTPSGRQVGTAAMGLLHLLLGQASRGPEVAVARETLRPLDLAALEAEETAVEARSLPHCSRKMERLTRVEAEAGRSVARQAVPAVETAVRALLFSRFQRELPCHFLPVSVKRVQLWDEILFTP